MGIPTEDIELLLLDARLLFTEERLLCEETAEERLLAEVRLLCEEIADETLLLVELRLLFEEVLDKTLLLTEELILVLTGSNFQMALHQPG